jgi:hypothetical protein
MKIVSLGLEDHGLRSHAALKSASLAQASRRTRDHPIATDDAVAIVDVVIVVGPMAATAARPAVLIAQKN